MGVINSPLVEGGVFSEEVNKKEVTVNGVNSNKCAILTSSTVPARVASGFFYVRIPFMDFR